MDTQAQTTLVTKADAARIKGYSYSTIARLVKAGVLTEVRPAPGMNPRLRLQDVLALGERDGSLDSTETRAAR